MFLIKQYTAIQSYVCDINTKKKILLPSIIYTAVRSFLKKFNLLNIYNIYNNTHNTLTWSKYVLVV